MTTGDHEGAALTVWWQGYTGPARVRRASSPSEALALLDEAARDGRVMVLFEAPDGGTLSVGCGGATSVLCFEETLDPPYFISTGGTGPGGEDFSTGGHWTDFEAEAYVSPDVARTAVEEFARTHRRPVSVAWADT